MAQATSTLRKLAAGAATVVFGLTSAHAGGLIDNDKAIINYRPDFLKSVSATIKDPDVGGRAGGFIKEMEAALKAPTDKPLFVDYPKRAPAELLRFIAVTPPKGLESADIPVCAEKDNKVLGLWTISANGAVKPVTDWKGSMVSATPTSSACKAFIFTARDAMLAQSGAGQPQATAPAAQPPPVAGTTTVAAARLQ